MRTLAEFLEERSVRFKVEREAHLARCRALLESSAGAPLFLTPEERTFTGELLTKVTLARKGNREFLRSAVAAGKVDLYDLACDHCGTGLVDDTASLRLGIAGCRHIGCPGCGWSGYINWSGKDSKS